MNLSIFDELELFSKELQRYMSPDALEQLGVTIHAHQLKNGNKMSFRSNKLKNS
ncbi:hypothetical protein [Bacillus cereus group sp. BfR-BA-01310]|uniref:hypothetical protein n=1 Tax=Bacillus cereus group sp. BfR-BA-01310 TaxID=2920287 RepID=UPI001F5850AB|nr:hypothetical protein [Bacillus cereus group sp. BfR-BA-01310]